MPKNDNITKDPSEAGKKGGANNKGKKHLRTLIKQALKIDGIKWSDVERITENNILEFLTHPDAEVRMQATRFFAEFVKPKKKEAEIKTTITIEDILEDDDLN